MERGARHFQEFERLAGDYLSGISQVTLEPDFEASLYRVTTRLPEPPLEIAAAFGDCLHNFRASLDYLARRLVVASGREPRGGQRGTAFPISTKPDPNLDIQPGLHPLLRDRLVEVQPLLAENPDQHPLARLNALDNIDKHRFLNLSTGSVSADVAFVNAGETAAPNARRYPLRLRTGQPDHVAVDREDLHEHAETSGGIHVPLM